MDNQIIALFELTLQNDGLCCNFGRLAGLVRIGSAQETRQGRAAPVADRRIGREPAIGSPSHSLDVCKT